MASGDTLFILSAQDWNPPGADAATVDKRSGGSTPSEEATVLDYDASAIEYGDWLNLVMPEHYGGGGITSTFIWMASSATSGVTRWGAALRRIADDAEDTDASHSYDFNDVDATAASASGELDYTDLTHTDGADMDSVAAGDAFHYRVRRNATHANDTMSGDAELVAIHIKET